MTRCLLDANILLRLVEPGAEHHQVTVDAIDKLHQNYSCTIVPQTLYEFWTVSTRPLKVNGLGHLPADAVQRIDGFLQLFDLLRDERRIYEEWQSLVKCYSVLGASAHDARYVAAMKRHEITHLLTLNAKHFRRYSEITLLTPQEVLKSK